MTTPSMGDNGESDRIPVARVRKPVGYDGSLAVTLYSGDPDRISPGSVVYVRGREETITAARPGARGSTVVRLESVTTFEQADRLRDAEFEVNAEDLPESPPGVYYHFQIIGAMVHTVDGKVLGQVREILETGGNDVYVVAPPNDGNAQDSAKDVLIPAISDVVLSIDVDAGIITVDPPDGLL